MNLTEWAVKNKHTVLIFSCLLLIGGMVSYSRLGKLKNPEFTIQTAVVITEYPGASAEEVDMQVTEVIEKYAQKLASLKHVRSYSSPDVSVVYVDIQDSFPPEAMPQIWDELRERMENAEADLPDGAQTPEVIDHFGDTYGVFLALTGDGFSYDELRVAAEYMQKRLKLCDNVAQVELFAVQEQNIVVELSRERMANLSADPEILVNTLNNQNNVAYFGSLNASDSLIRLHPAANFTSLNSIENLVIPTRDNHLVKLGDIATVFRDYKTPADTLFRFDGKPALGIGISTVAGGNTIDLGRAVKAKLAELTTELPDGLDINIVNFQADGVRESINEFILALAEAILIVLVVLLLSLGWRSAVVITNGLLVNICGTFILMSWFGIDLQLVSISSLIIVLGMLVDDSVVVTDNVMVRLRDPQLTTDDACIHAARATGWPQLIATVIAIASFLPIDMAQSSTGEYCKTLFQVVAIALGISWVQAMTVVPVLSGKLLKPGRERADPYGTRFYTAYKNLLTRAMRHCWLTTALLVILLAAAVWGFTFIPYTFMPDDSRDQFFVNYWLPEGTRMERTSADLQQIENDLLTWPEITHVTTTVGSGPLRFLLTFTPEPQHTCYGSMIIQTRSKADVDATQKKVRTYLSDHFPEADPLVTDFSLSGAPDYGVEARFSGEDPVVLRTIADEAMKILAANSHTRSVRQNWRNRIPVLEPEYDQTAALSRGVNLPALSQSLLRITHGLPIGTYRESDQLIPILVRAPADEWEQPLDLANQPVWGQNDQSVPAASVLNDRPVQLRESTIWRYDRIRTITVQCNPVDGVTIAALQNELSPLIESMKLPTGYTLAWGGQKDFSDESNNSVAQQLPLALSIMFIAVVLLFNGIKQPIIILLTLPLSIVGITVAMLLSGKGMGFMAMLGMLSLIGMMIRNAVILIGEIDEWIAKGTPPWTAVIDASVTRVRPVMITACTTTFGMIPLINDTLFGAMSVTIMGGLMFATILTLVFIPVLYVMIYRISSR